MNKIRQDVQCLLRRVRGPWCSGLSITLVRAEADPLGQLVSMILLAPNDPKKMFRGAALDAAACDRLIEILQTYRAELDAPRSSAPTAEQKRRKYEHPPLRPQTPDH